MPYLSRVFKDIPSSFVVFLVALPLCMGISIASGVPPALGLITGIVGGIVTGMIAGAPLQVSGPAAGLTVLVFQLVDEYGLAALGPVVFMSGLLQVMAGSARLGQWFRAVNPAVIYGMLSGIGVLIISSQVHIAFDSKPGGTPLENLTLVPAVFAKLVSIENEFATGFAGLISVVTLVVLFVWDKYKPSWLKSIPAPLFGVVLATLAAYMFSLPVEYVKLPSSIIAAVGVPTWEQWKILLDSSVFTSAIGLAVIASAETLLCASALRKMRSDAEVRYNKELVAQGLGNTVCGLLGALPMTGVIIRSSANIAANAQTRWSAVFHGVWLLLFVLAVPELLQFIPMAALAAVLIYTGVKLVNPAIVRSLSRYGRPAVTIYFITLFGIVFTDLLTGVLLGVLASFIRLLTIFSNLKISQYREGHKFHVVIKGAATFLTLPKLAHSLESIALSEKVAIHFDEVFYVDHACMDLLESQKMQRETSGGALEFDSSRLKFTWRCSESGTISYPGDGKLIAAESHQG